MFLKISQMFYKPHFSVEIYVWMHPIWNSNIYRLSPMFWNVFKVTLLEFRISFCDSHQLQMYKQFFTIVLLFQECLVPLSIRYRYTNNWDKSYSSSSFLEKIVRNCFSENFSETNNFPCSKLFECFQIDWSTNGMSQWNLFFKDISDSAFTEEINLSFCCQFDMIYIVLKNSLFNVLLENISKSYRNFNDLLANMKSRPINVFIDLY